MQHAFQDYVASIQPDKNGSISEELQKVRAAISGCGKWHDQDEWRISTYFDTEIKHEINGDSSKFFVRVECDGQEFKAYCPSLEKAFLVSKFYQRIIIDQFYSVGPPWA
jgi:hypothetical protein